MEFDGMTMKFCITCNTNTLHRISGNEVRCLRCDTTDVLYKIFKNTWDNRKIS